MYKLINDQNKLNITGVTAVLNRTLHDVTTNGYDAEISIACDASSLSVGECEIFFREIDEAEGELQTIIERLAHLC